MNMVQYLASRVSVLLTASLLALSLTACTSDYSDDLADPEAASLGDALTVPVTSATVDDTSSPPAVYPVINFSVTDQRGRPVAGVPISRLRFTIAKLVPAEPYVTGTGEPSYWQSYINQIETPGGVGPGTLDTVQATYERNTAGLVDHGNGSYTYTFETDVAGAVDPITLSLIGYDETLTHRVGIQLSGGGYPVGNGAYTWRPDGGAIAETRDIVKTETCNQCHGKLALHGSGRVEIKYCVTCHNPGTTDANSTNTVDFTALIHKLHRGEDLPSVVGGGEYAIWGYNDSKHDYSTVIFPQDIRNCTRCHVSGADTPEAGNWKGRPSSQACGSCHDDVDFTTGTNHPAGARPNSECKDCHDDAVIAIGDSHEIPAQAAAATFAFNILGVTNTAPGQFPAITFSVTDPTNANAAYDITTDPAFTTGGGVSRLAIDLGWDTRDYNNTGSGSAPGSPISINALSAPTDNLNGTYTVTSTVAIPLTAMGTGVVAIEGHPAADYDGDTIFTDRVPVKNVVGYFPITDTSAVPRRRVVDIAKCNQCHGSLSLHGSNRTDEPQVCVICHNANNTDINRRPATVDTSPADGVFDDFTAVGSDGKREEAIDFKTMIHAIHAGEAAEHGFRELGIEVYGYSGNPIDFSHVRFPGVLSNCETCHLPGTYTPPLGAGVLGTTVQSADGTEPVQANREAALADPADDLNISPTAAVCASCHDGATAQTHMVDNGASFGVTQALVSAGGEACGACHGSSGILGVKQVHGIR